MPTNPDEPFLLSNYRVINQHIVTNYGEINCLFVFMNDTFANLT